MYDTVTWSDIRAFEDEDSLCEGCYAAVACVGEDLCQDCRDEWYLEQASMLEDEDFGPWE